MVLDMPDKKWGVIINKMKLFTTLGTSELDMRQESLGLLTKSKTHEQQSFNKKNK